MSAPPPLSPDRRRALHRVAEVITPAVLGFPAFSDADPDDEVTALAMVELSRDMNDVMAVLDRAARSEDVVGLLDEVWADDPDAFSRTWLFVVGTYLSTHAVWEALGYRGRVLDPVRPGEAAEHLDEDLLGPVRSRGPVFRHAPE
jgi:hypothetical protein